PSSRSRIRQPRPPPRVRSAPGAYAGSFEYLHSIERAVRAQRGRPGSNDGGLRGPSSPQVQREGPPGARRWTVAEPKSLDRRGEPDPSRRPAGELECVRGDPERERHDEADDQGERDGHPTAAAEDRGEATRMTGGNRALDRLLQAKREQEQKGRPGPEPAE